MVGLALVSTMAIVGASSKASLDKTIADNFQGDLVVSNVVGERFSPSLADRIEKTPGVASVTRLRYATPKINGKYQQVTAVNPERLDDAVRVPMITGNPTDLTDSGVLVDEGRADRDHLHVGDTVTMRMPAGTLSFHVTGVIKKNNPVLSTPYTVTLGALTNGGYRAADSFLFIDKQPGASLSKVKGDVEDAIGDVPTVTVKDQAGFAAEQRDQFNQLLVLVYAMLVLALVIAVLGIINTLALSVIERTHEVGLLRAIGLSRRQLRRMVRLEAVVIAVFGALLGVVMGVVFGVALMASLRDQGLEVTSVPVVQLAVIVLGAAVCGVLAAAFPARRAARLDVLRAIAAD
jgi:putative ABC transport system permease protein